MPSWTCWPRTTVSRTSRRLTGVSSGRSGGPHKPATGGTQPWAVGRASTGEWKPAPAELTQWENWGVPELAGYDGMMWYRARVKLSAAQAKQAASVSLEVIDDVDLVWINGKPIGSGEGEDERVYRIPAKLLKAGENVVVVNVFDMWGSGGMHGQSKRRGIRFDDGSLAPLSGWEYQLPPPGLSSMPRAPWEPYAGINILYNAMIAPLGKFGLRGVAWYQGEANAGLDDAKRYQAQLQMLFTDWRRQFDFPLPFFVVQLANWNALATTPVDSGWARLRDAQRRAVLEDGNAGLAVTIDIGNRDDIHPTNKQDVGKRLARAARHVVFGEKLSASGRAAEVSAAHDFRRGGDARRLRRPAGRDRLRRIPPASSCAAKRRPAATSCARSSVKAASSASRIPRRKRRRACASAGPTRRCAISSIPKDCRSDRSKSPCSNGDIPIFGKWGHS